MAEAYQAQELLVQTKLDQGHKIVGPKMGLTSKAKWDQMGVTEPIYGYVFDYMLLIMAELFLFKFIQK